MRTFRAAAVALAITVLVAVPSSSAAAREADPCARFGAPEAGGAVAEPGLVELSGLAASRNHSDVLWGHNDSGGAPELYAFAEDGTSLGAYPVEGALAVDWEDMATGPGPGADAVLYVGDLGDNDAVRPSVTLYRVYEPDRIPTAPGEPLVEVDTIAIQYPAGPVDAEALLIDPRTGDLVIVTKSVIGASRVMSAPARALVDGAEVMLRVDGRLRVPFPPDPGPGLPGTMVTGGDVSPDGSLVVLRTYRSVLVFERSDGQTIADALLGDPCFAPQAEEDQGEAIAFTADGTAFVTVSEGVNPAINRIEISAPASASITTTSTAPPVGGDDVVRDSTDRRPVLVAAVVVALLLVALIVWARRRRSAG